MNQGDLQIDSHVVFHHVPLDKARTGIYVGYDAANVEFACIRTEGDRIEMANFSMVELDPTYHWQSEFGENRLCACGHSYHRHFDCYDQDNLYPTKPSPIGCKYCDCRRWHHPTKTNQLNRLHDNRVYEIELTQPQRFDYHRLDGEHYQQKPPVDFPAGAVFTNVSTFSADFTTEEDLKPVYRVLYGVNFTHEGQRWIGSPLWSDGFKILKRQWMIGHTPTDADLFLEGFQPKELQLERPAKEPT